MMQPVPDYEIQEGDPAVRRIDDAIAAAQTDIANGRSTERQRGAPQNVAGMAADGWFLPPIGGRLWAEFRGQPRQVWDSVLMIARLYRMARKCVLTVHPNPYWSRHARCRGLAWLEKRDYIRILRLATSRRPAICELQPRFLAVLG
ncbi:MAG: hypothetical protein ACRD2H_13045 [Terriglobales bacterium]